MKNKVKHFVSQYYDGRISGSTLFYLAWAICTFFYFLFCQSELALEDISGILYALVKLIVLILLATKVVCFDVFTYKEFGLFCLLSLPFCIAMYTTQSTFIVIALAFVFSFKNIDFKKLIKLDLTIKILSVAVIFILCFLGILDNYSDIINGTYKQALGFTHPNTMGITLVTMLMEMIYLNKLFKTDGNFIIFGLTFIVIYYISGSRTAIYMLILITILSFFLRKLRSFKLCNLLIMLSTPLCAMFSFLFAYMYPLNISLINFINTVVTGRIQLAYKFLNYWGISIFGQHMTIVSTRLANELNIKSNVLDNAFVKLGIEYGIIVLIIILIGYMCINALAIKRKDYSLITLTLFFSCFGIMESHFYQIQFNLTFLFLFTAIYQLLLKKYDKSKHFNLYQNIKILYEKMRKKGAK